MSAEWLLAARSFRDLILIDSRAEGFSNSKPNHIGHERSGWIFRVR